MPPPSTSPCARASRSRTATRLPPMTWCTRSTTSSTTNRWPSPPITPPTPAREKIDDFHVRLKLTGVSPAVMEYLAMVTPIWPKAYREKIGADAYARAPIGTGPYKITKVDGTTEIDMERYDGYYAGSPKGRPAIRYIKIHEVPDATTELTELLGGKADWIWGYNADQFANIARMPNLNSVRFGTMRVHFMTVDGAGRSGAVN